MRQFDVGQGKSVGLFGARANEHNIKLVRSRGVEYLVAINYTIHETDHIPGDNEQWIINDALMFASLRKPILEKHDF